VAVTDTQHPLLPFPCECPGKVVGGGGEIEEEKAPEEQELPGHKTKQYNVRGKGDFWGRERGRSVAVAAANNYCYSN